MDAATEHITSAQNLRGLYDDPSLDADMDRVAGLIANGSGLTDLGMELLQRALNNLGQLGNDARVALVLLNQSRAFQLGGKMQAALQSIERAAAIANLMRPQTVSADLRATFSNWRREIDQQHVGVLVGLASTGESPAYSERAWRVAQDSKARSLFEFVGSSKKSVVSQHLSTEHQRLLRSLSGTAYQRLKAKEDRQAEAEKRYLAALREVETFEAKNELTPAAPPESSLTLGQVQELLHPDEVLLEYFLIDDGPGAWVGNSQRPI